MKPISTAQISRGQTFRIVEIAPDQPEGGEAGTVAAAHSEFQGAHATDTLGYVTILRGEVTLIVGGTEVLLRPRRPGSTAARRTARLAEPFSRPLGDGRRAAQRALSRTPVGGPPCASCSARAPPTSGTSGRPPSLPIAPWAPIPEVGSCQSRNVWRRIKPASPGSWRPWLEPEP
jgi:hypothetical protein